MNAIQVLSIACITLFSVLGLFILLDRKSNLKGRWPGILFLLLGLNFLDGSLFISGFYLDFPHLALWEDPAPFIYGPAIFLYSQQLIKGSTDFRKNVLVHFIPFLVLELIMIITFHLQPVEFKQSIIESVMNSQQSKFLFLPISLVFIHIFIYIFFTKRSINNYRKTLKDHYSSFDISQFERAINFLILIMVISFGSSFLQYFASKKIFEFSLVIVILFMLAFAITILFTALRQPLFTYQLPQERVSSINLSESEVNSISEKIKSALSREKYFLNADLTIDELASQLNIPSRKISQVINTAFSQNFYDLINRYRIEEAQRILKESDDPKLTVLEVMYQVGFNSKSSFNTQFKKKVGLTPTEYRKINR